MKKINHFAWIIGDNTWKNHIKKYNEKSLENRKNLCVSETIIIYLCWSNYLQWMIWKRYKLVPDLDEF